jgi:hypothetical protein
MTLGSGVTSTKAPCTTPMNIARKIHWWSRSKTWSRILIRKSDQENIENIQIIDANPTATVTTTTIQTKELVDPEEGECLFHSHMWVKGTPLNFIVNNDNQNNLISAKVVKQLGLSTTPHLQPYNIEWLHQGRDLCVSQQCRLSYGIQPFKDEVVCDVTPLDVCDVVLGQPYMWRRHAVYESRPRNVIITLAFHLLGLGFWMSRVLAFMFIIKQPS